MLASWRVVFAGWLVSLVGCSGSDDSELADRTVDAGSSTDSDSGGGDGDGDGDSMDAAVDAALDASSDPLDAGKAPEDGAVADADAGDAGDAGDAEEDPPPPIDAGADCWPPTDLPLSPTQAGLPTAGLKLWLRGDRGVYKTASNAVCAWRDQTKTATVFTPEVHGFRPQWETAATGGHDAIHFDQVDERLTANGVLGIPAQSARTLVIVQSLVSTTGRFGALFQAHVASPGTWVGVDSNTFMSKGSLEGVYLLNNSYDSDVPTETGARLHVLLIEPMTIGGEILPHIQYRVDAAPRSLVRNPGGLGDGNFEDFSAADFTLIGYMSAGADAYVAEALIYDHALTAQELQQLEQTLSARYGISEAP